MWKLEFVEMLMRRLVPDLHDFEWMGLDLVKERMERLDPELWASYRAHHSPHSRKMAMEKHLL